ncbi:porin [Paraburkholderia solisilvae]|uniref:Outer membrane porin protein n=1 Tax=Paraburkholderia solisilvae TaxID=624376 RepID=A0A6J5CVK0_9BURK|nr:porin [Paraburkholderia solisilvae]CAB3746008.1 Outer membrane porin protein [Paraburkholderia solisilvae]
MNRLLCCSLAGAYIATQSTTAGAQSVTLYGELDAGLAYVSNVNGHTQYRATSGLIDGSFWGLQGTEALGDGTQALFRLERGYSVSSGEQFNDHPAYVGLQSNPFGTLTLGHQYDLVHDYFAPFTLTGGTGGTAFAHPFDNDNANNSYLAANSVKYASASYGGFSFGGMYAFSNAAGRFAQNRAYGIGANYANGPFSAGASWMHNNGRGLTENGAFEAASLPGVDQPVVDASAQKQDTIAAGASYVIGDVTLAGAWSRAIYTGVADTDSGAALPSIAFSNYEISAIWSVTPTIALAGMYVYTDASSTHWHQGALQAVYQLSKRTDVYAEAIYQRASENGLAVINTNDPSSNRNQVLVATGIRHRF